MTFNLVNNHKAEQWTQAAFERYILSYIFQKQGMKYSSEINILHLPYFYFPCIFTQTENIEGVGGIGDDGENGFEKHSKKLSLNIGQMQ